MFRIAVRGGYVSARLHKMGGNDGEAVKLGLSGTSVSLPPGDETL